MSGVEYDPIIHDSFIVVDTFMKDGGWNPTLVQFRQSVKRNEVDYPRPKTDTTIGWIGAIFGGVNLMPTPKINIDTPTRLGDLVLKIRHPYRPVSFEITFDSSFYPPAGTFVFHPTVGLTFYSPALRQVSVISLPLLHVNNSSRVR
jgi:hypothetical protein